MLLGIAQIQTQRARALVVLGRITITFALLGLVSACSSGDMSDLRGYVSGVKAKPGGRIPPLPEFKSYETFAYSADTLRDPFEMFQNEAELVQASQTARSGPKPDEKRNRETLEQYPLDTLRFVGQLEKDNEQWAIVTSPDSLVHRVKAGNFIGQNFGKITAVTEAQLEITELVPDGLGGWIERNAALSLGD